MKSAAPGIALRTCLKGKEHLNLKLLNRIPRPHFKEQNAVTLFNELITVQQSPSESAQEFHS